MREYLFLGKKLLNTAHPPSFVNCYLLCLKSLLTVQQSCGRFASGRGGGGCSVARSIFIHHFGIGAPFVYLPRADPGFFLGGGALVSCSTSTPINHIVFFWQNTSCIRKPQVISGGGRGIRTPCTLPLDLPLLPLKEWYLSYIPTYRIFLVAFNK